MLRPWIYADKPLYSTQIKNSLAISYARILHIYKLYR
uniref:Uncharacterized protein n=1 Tax=Anguilla anguilla TaxID=7936 RepID=A0A0E9QZ10_ANGAN